MKASEKILNKVNNGFHICVGLDTDLEKIPKHLLGEKDPIFLFNKIIIESTYEESAAYKLNFAFYEKMGQKGFESIQKTLEIIPKDIFVIGDAKRGDIGNTSQMYAKAVFDELNFDSVTLHPYMGFDSVQPFLDYSEKINFILALTSNSSAEDFEKQKLENGKYLYQEVIEKVNLWNEKNNCGIVFGATKIEELKANISSFGDLFVLLPGIGAQGGNLEDVVSIFNDYKKKKYLVNVSRALLYCDSTIEFHKKVRNMIKDYNNSVFSIEK